MPRQLPGVTWTTFITRQRSFWCWMIMPTRSCVAGINIGRNPPGGATERDHACTTGDGETPPAPSRGLRLAEPVRGPGEDEPILGREGTIGIRNLVPVSVLRVALDGEHGHAVAGAAVDLPQRAPDPARRRADRDDAEVPRPARRSRAQPRGDRQLAERGDGPVVGGDQVAAGEHAEDAPRVGRG